MDQSLALYRLKNLTNHNNISVFKDQFKIGRNTTNDLSIANNRFISSSHCTFEYEHGHLYLRDTSSNGTLINRTNKISKNDSPVELYSGDIIHLVFRKDEPESNIVFEIDLPLLKSDEDLSIYDEDTQMATYPSIPPISPNQTQENADLSTLMNTSADVEPKPIPKPDFYMEPGDAMEDVLTCVCCQEIMSNPVSLEPCLHAFCSECYASWEVVQRTCPKCRVKVTGKKKNFVINGILEAYLKAYPHKKPEAKLVEDDLSKKKNNRHEVGPDGMYLYNTQYPNFDDEEAEEEEEMEHDEDDDEDMEDDEDDQQNNYPFAPVIFAPIPPPPPPMNARFACRQCPRPGLANADGFQCAANQNHILCQCCIQPMPDRRDEANIHQHCEICHQFFCHMYFQPCQRMGCLGCLNRLRDFNFAPRHLNDLINGNTVESKIVQDYLTNNQKTIRDLLIECCDRLDRQEFACHGIDRHAAVPSWKIVCYKCGLKMFQELAYQFRVQMPLTDINPVILRNRVNCYYGKRCRTQFTKIPHAEKFNHACDQVKF